MSIKRYFQPVDGATTHSSALEPSSQQMPGDVREAVYMFQYISDRVAQKATTIPPTYIHVVLNGERYTVTWRTGYIHTYKKGFKV